MSCCCILSHFLYIADGIRSVCAETPADKPSRKSFVIPVYSLEVGDFKNAYHVSDQLYEQTVQPWSERQVLQL